MVTGARGRRAITGAVHTVGARRADAMNEWKPMRTTYGALVAMSEQETALVEQLDGRASVSELAAALGVAPSALHGVLTDLIARGAVAADAASPAGAGTADASPDAASPGVTTRADVQPGREEPASMPALSAEAAADEPGGAHVTSDAAVGGEALAIEPLADADPDPTAAEPETDPADYRALYERLFHPLDRDARVAAATQASGPELLALCFDADPRVIHAVLANASTGLDHARLIAAHHKNPVGLDQVVARAELARDAQVQRKLLRNDQLSERLLARLLAGKPLLGLFKAGADRDLPERNRVQARAVLRRSWARAASEERADLVLRTEGRVLAMLVGQTFDARTTALLCARAHASMTLIQNLARFGACPPALLVHLVKIPSVRRNPQVRRLLLQHPNMPGDMKRQLG
jgi:hypothetical protein